MCERMGCGADFAHTDCDRSVGIKPFLIGHQIELDEIARSDHTPAGNPVDGFIIDADAERARKAVDLWRCGFGPVLGQYAGADFV
jgi:hypothetical protein